MQFFYFHASLKDSGRCTSRQKRTAKGMKQWFSRIRSREEMKLYEDFT